MKHAENAAQDASEKVEVNLQANEVNAQANEENAGPAENPAEAPEEPNAADQNGVVVYQAISEDMAPDGLDFVENEVPLVTKEEKVAALKMCYRLAVLRKFNIRMRDAENKPIKHELTINGVDFKPKLPAVLLDKNGIPTENIATYHERAWVKAKIAFCFVLKGIERIDFAPKLG